MTAQSITSIALNSDWKLAVDTNAEGLYTFCLAHNARVISQLVRLSLATSESDIPWAPRHGFPWLLYIGIPNPPYQLMGSFINGIISRIHGVTSVDLSETDFNEITNTLGPICYTVDCANSQEEFETCL